MVFYKLPELKFGNPDAETIESQPQATRLLEITGLESYNFNEAQVLNFYEF